MRSGAQGWDLAESPGPLIALHKTPSAPTAGAGETSLRTVFNLHYHTPQFHFMQIWVMETGASLGFAESALTLQHTCPTLHHLPRDS